MRDLFFLVGPFYFAQDWVNKDIDNMHIHKKHQYQLGKTCLIALLPTCLNSDVSCTSTTFQRGAHQGNKARMYKRPVHLYTHVRGDVELNQCPRLAPARSALELLFCLSFFFFTGLGEQGH